MSKQALIDSVWRERLLTYSALMPPASPVPALRPEPGRTRAQPLPGLVIAATALAAFAGVALGAALRFAVRAPRSRDDDIDWLSGLA